MKTSAGCSSRRFCTTCTKPTRITDLVRDKTEPTAPVSIAAVGMALATIPVIVERGVIIREFAAKITRKRLRFLYECPQGPEPDASGYKGFFYHFLDIETGRRVWQCELVHHRFGIPVRRRPDGRHLLRPRHRRRSRDSPTGQTLYHRADWNWARDGGPTLTHGWRPENGFIPHRWQGYDEGLLLYILGLGSPTHPLPPESYRAYCATYQWKNIYDRELLYSGPLFTHQLSHLWIDFRDLRDAFMRKHDSDYFENSRQATFVQQEYAIRNPDEFRGLWETLLGIHGMRRARLGKASSQRRRTGILRLHRSRRSIRPRRRHGRPVGRGRLAPVRSGNRHPDGSPFCPNGLGNDADTDSSRRSINRLP